jgi:hypothetical protein
VTTETAPSPDLTADPALAVAERQLVMLRELAELAMGVSRAFAATANEATKAEKTILADKYFMPEVGRARACGAKEAAESFQKVSRAARLTMRLELTVAETLRDLRAGVIAPATTTPFAQGQKPARLTIGDAPTPTAIRPEADDEGQAARVERPGGERERLFDIEASERLPRGAYCRVVDDLAADVGTSVDWDSATMSAPDLGDIVRPRTGVRREPRSEPPRRQDRQAVRAERAGSG